MALRPTEHLELFDQDLADHYPERVSEIRDRCPVAWSDAAWSENDAGFWLLTKFDDVSAAGANWQTFSSARGAAPMQFDLDVMRMVPLETDPPVHRNIRRVLTPFFALEASKDAEDDIRRIVGELLDDCAAKDPCEFVRDFSVAMPARVFFEVFLQEDPAETAALISAIEKLFAFPDEAIEHAPELLMWSSDVLEKRRAEGRTDDVLGAVAHAGNDPDFHMEEIDRIFTVLLLILAGMETTGSGLSNIAYRLASDGALRLQVRELDRAGLERAVDEFLRFDSPVPASGRTLATDTEIRGCPMANGERVTLNWAAANRDPDAFADPDELDIERTDANKHLAFGAGQHRCLGSHLAKRELRIAVEEICKLTTFELVAGTQIAYRAGPARGPHELPIRCVR